MLARYWRFSTLLFLILTLTACANRQVHRQIPDAIISGNLDPIIAELSSADLVSTDASLQMLNLGMAYRIKGDYQASINAWRQAKNIIAQLRPASFTEITASFLINDNSQSFIGSYQEQQWLYIFQALNYIDINRIDGARVELLQADQLHKEYGKGTIEPPFMRYLAGMVFEHRGEYDQALVAYRKALALYTEAIMPVPRFLYSDKARMLKKLGINDELMQFSRQHNISHDDLEMPNVTLIWVQGLVSQKRERRLTHWAPKYNRSFSLVMPYYPRNITMPVTNSISISTGTTLAFETAARIDASIRKEFAGVTNVLLAKALVRQVLKKKISDVFIGKKKKQVSQTVLLISSLLTVMTESADLRSWNSLPYSVLIYRGKHKLGTLIQPNGLPKSEALRISDENSRIFSSFFRLL